MGINGMENDVDTLKQDTRDAASDAVQSAKNTYAAVKDKVTTGIHQASDKAKCAAKAVDSHVHEKPWTSVLIAVGVGMFLGMLVRGRGPSNLA